MTRHKDKVEPRRLKGFQDYNPEIMQARYQIMDAVRAVANLAGFQAIGTPALEYAEVLLGVGGETDKQVFRFMDNGERDVALRFDLTVPFARYVAEHQGSLHFPFKRMQIGDVWRAEKPQKGRFREFGQCDLDIIGVNSIEADVEILVCLQSIVGRVVSSGFTMTVGNRVLLSSLIRRTLGDLAPGGEEQALIVIDKLAKVPADKIADMLAEIPGATREGAVQLLEVLHQKDASGNSDLAAFAARLQGDSEALAELDRLKETVQLAQKLTADSRGKLRLDLSVARGLGYYTGIVFETTLDDLPGFGSICSGGRYNRLVERYLDRELAGIGGSIGLDRLVAGLVELKSLPPVQRGKTAFVAIATEDARAYSFAIAQSLRQQGISCDIALKTGKVGAQFKHADRLGYPFVVTVGTEELAAQVVRVKEMSTGAETAGMPLTALASYLAERFAP